MFPAASYAEKEGTMTHPDGRVQRLRQADRPPGRGAPAGAVLLELMHAPGRRPRAICSAPQLTAADARRGARSTQASRSRRSAAAGCAGRSATRRRLLDAPRHPGRAARAAARAARGHEARHRADAVGRARDAPRAGAALPRPAPAGRAVAPRTPSASASAPATRSRWRRTARRCARSPRCVTGVEPGTVFLLEGIDEDNASRSPTGGRGSWRCAQGDDPVRRGRLRRERRWSS